MNTFKPTIGCNIWNPDGIAADDAACQDVLSGRAIFRMVAFAKMLNQAHIRRGGFNSGAPEKRGR
ncbi:MAG: hypothetical protein HKL95_00415 [Phycisphaerae bacterium]|nr:hypothetical protein [Phycisphaerae bacterium]